MRTSSANRDPVTGLSFERALPLADRLAPIDKTRGIDKTRVADMSRVPGVGPAWPLGERRLGPLEAQSHGATFRSLVEQAGTHLIAAHVESIGVLAPAHAEHYGFDLGARV